MGEEIRLGRELKSRRRKLKVETSRITLQRKDDWFFFVVIQVYTSQPVMKQSESVFLQGFITPTYY